MKHLSSLGKPVYALWLLLTGHAAVAQPATELSATLRQISGQLRPVSGASRSFEQTLSFDKGRPYLLDLTSRETDNKGQTVATHYTFSLADIDPGGVVIEPRKDLMVLTVKTRDKQAFISQQADDVRKNNTSQLTLYGTDAENARVLADLFRKAAPLANKQFLADVQLPDTYDELIKWISSNLDAMPTGGESLQQSMELDRNNPLAVQLLQIRTQNGKPTEQLYQFNVADLNPQRVNLDVNGSVITVVLENKDRFIRSRKNGQWERNTTTAGPMCLTGYKARMMQLAWQKLIPLAARQLESQRVKFTQYTSLNDGLNRLSAAVRPVEEGTNHLEQQLTPACLTTLSLKATGRQPLEETYRFLWSDLDGRNAKLRVDGGSFVLEIPAKDKGKWIATTRNGQRGAYENTVRIKSTELEPVRFVPLLLEKLIADCQKAGPAPLPSGGMGWVAERITALQDPKGQTTYQLRKEGNCAYTYLVQQNTGKKTSELSWDIKLADLDPKAVLITISGSDLSIDLATTNKEKIMKAYKDGQPTSYTNQVSLLVNDLEIARSMVEIWKQSIAGCHR